MSDDLERRLRDAVRPTDFPTAPSRLRSRLSELENRPVTRRRRTSKRLLVLLPVAAVLALGLSTLMGGGPRPSVPVPTPRSSSPHPAQTGAPTASLAPSSNVPSPSPVQLSDAGAVEDAGTFPGGGLWAIRGTTLLVSTDAGTTWRRTSIPASAYAGPQAVDVLDDLHAWRVTLGPGSTGFSGASTDVTHYVVSRTVDGGRTWQSSDIAGNFAGTGASVAFVDASHGYLLAAAYRNSFGTSTVLRTADGGTTWSVANTQPWLGALLTTSDAATVWVGGEEEAGGQFLQSLLTVSRDTGRTWSDVQLPGVTGVTEADCDCYLAEPPHFLDAANGFVTVVSNGSDGNGETRIEQTTDGGHTWRLAADRPGIVAVGLAILDRTHWLLAGSTVERTADGGTTWTTLATGGAWANSYIEWIGAVDGRHAAMLVPIPGSSLYRSVSALLVTSDGGTTWLEADLGAPSSPSSASWKVDVVNADAPLILSITTSSAGYAWLIPASGRMVLLDLPTPPVEGTIELVEPGSSCRLLASTAILPTSFTITVRRTGSNPDAFALDLTPGAEQKGLPNTSFEGGCSG